MNKTSVIRDFKGGLNVVDDDLNLVSDYQVVLDNIHRGIDSSLSVRPGYELFADLLDGTVTEHTASFEISVTNASRAVVCNWNSHPFSNREHINFTTPVTIGGITLSGIYGVSDTGTNSFTIWHRDPATSTTAATASRTVSRDDHMLAGDVLEVTYYDNHLVVVDNIGEICKIDEDGTKTRIFDVAYANALSGTPIGWVNCSFVCSDVFRGDLILVNGEDKPLLINFDNANEVEFLQDIPTGTNTNTPVCKYVRSVGKWLVMAGDPEFPYRVHISATDAGGTWVGDDAPNDAVQVDVNNVSNSPSQVIRGIHKFRDNLVVAFDDTFVLVTLGIYDGDDHVPDINDTIARHGAVSHKSMIFLGYDLVSADPIGVTSIAKSLYDSTVVPTRLSEFIAPLLQRNINRLSNDTLENKIFAVYSTHDTRYILFMNDFDDDQITLGYDPFYVVSDHIGDGLVIVEKRQHGFEIGDSITIAGATGFSGITAGNLNTTHSVYGVIDEDFFVIDTAGTSTIAGQGGGNAATITRNKTETTGYAYTYNKGLRIKTWARYRDMSFVAGCTSVYGRVFLATDNRIWRMGNRFEPIFSDLYNNYDVIWDNSTAYTVGQKVYDSAARETYTCLEAHTSHASDTFAEDRDNNPSYWERYEGEEIVFAAEWPWADFDKRDLTKAVQRLGIDARGKGSFTLQTYFDYFYKDRLNGTRTPGMEMGFVGGDTGGYGAGAQAYGAGRIATRQRLWPWPARAKLVKFRIEGQTRYDLRIVALIIRYRLLGIDR